jgi:serine protease Do
MRTSSKYVALLSTIVAFAAILSSGLPSLAESLSIEPPEELAGIRAGRPPRNASQLKQLEAHLQRLAEVIPQCTVAIQVGPAHGSGVIVSADGHVLTAAHVAIEPDLPALVILSSGRVLRGKTMGMNVALDAGMIKVETSKELPYLDMAKGEVARNGQWCLAAGHPGGFDLERGTVLRVGRIIDIDKFVRSDCPIVGGDSGGPLINLAGEVIAIHSRIGSDLSNNQHVPIRLYHEGWDRMVKGDIFPVQAFIGVRGDTSSDEAIVTFVYEDSPADLADIQVDDVIRSADRRKIGTFGELIKFVSQKNPGDVVELTIRRGEEEVKTKLTLGGRLVKGSP